jgi:hypothetical protein
MPINMDCHDMEGATAKAVADAHQKDLKLQDKYGVKLLTYWFDEGRGSAFCLMDASAKDKDFTKPCECMKSNGKKRSLGEAKSTNFKTSKRKLYQMDSSSEYAMSVE